MQTQIRTYFPIDGGGVDAGARVIDTAGTDEDFDTAGDLKDDDEATAAGSNEMGPETVSGGNT
ncbi:hypothetical protein [Spirosoma pulveris]